MNRQISEAARKKAAQKSLISMTDATRAIARTIPEFFFLYHVQQQEIVYVSPQFFEMSEQQAGNRPLSQLVKEHMHPDDREAFDQFFTDLTEKNKYTGKIKLRSNGQLEDIRCLEIYTHPVAEREEGEEVTELVGHIQDVTDQQEHLQMLEQENQKLDHIIKILAHDLRSPFNKIHLIADLLRRNMSAEETKRHGKFLEMLEGIRGHSVEMLDQLLKLASLQGETKHIHFRRFDARQLLDKVAEHFQLLLEKKKISLILEKPDIQVAINADRLLLEQLLQNQLSNAIKFTPEGGQIRVAVSLVAPEKMKLVVEDSGIGIPQQAIPQLFKEFTRIRRKGLQGEESIGLGLAICKQIIDLHKGEIRVESEEGKGSFFIAQVPS